MIQAVSLGLALALLAPSSPSHSATGQREALAGRLDRILADKKLEGAIVSATVMDLDGRVLYEKNSGTRVMPASNQKILSGAFALHRYNQPGATLAPTRFWKEGSRLVIDCPGAPLLSASDLLKAKEQLGDTSGIKSVYLRQAYNPGLNDTWQIGDAVNRYCPSISALTIDRGGCELWVDKGVLTLRSTDPKVTYTPGLAPGDPDAPFRAEWDPYQNLVRFNGVPTRTKRLDTIAISNPVKEALTVLGVGGAKMEFKGTIPTRTPDLEIAGPEIKKVLKECLPSSDNFLAESLLQLGAAEDGKTETSFGGATEKMKSWLVKSVGVNNGDFRVADGSGLSRKNNVTTRGICQILRWADKAPTREVWRDSLAKSGSGTLANRLPGIQFFGKTGTLDMVVALSGYVKLSNGQERIVSVILNHYGCSSTEARVIVDRFIENVANQFP